MTSETPSNSRKRRIMIITADESVIQQIQNDSNVLLVKSVAIDSNRSDANFSPTTILHTLSDVHPQNTKQSNKRVKKAPLTCIICGAIANGYNFDAITCESCKAFFRRNALKDPAMLGCRRNGKCEVTIDSRRRCSSCRLAKCLRSGMRRDRLLTPEQKAIKHQILEKNRILTSTIVENDPDFDSNIEEDLTSSTSTIDQVNASTPIDTNPPVSTIQDDALSQPVTTIQNTDALLTPEEFAYIGQIQSLFEQRVEMKAPDGLPHDTSTYSNILLQQLNARSLSALQLLSFFKQIPEFNQLDVDDRVTLIKFNLLPLFIFNCTLDQNAENKTVTEAEYDRPWNSYIFIKIHGRDLFQKVKKIFESFVRIAQNDQRIIQLTLIALVLTKGFSTDPNFVEPILKDGNAVYRAQCVYSELLWKYLETVHGSRRATQMFTEIISNFISWQTIQSCVRHNILTKLSPTELNGLMPIMKSLLLIP